MDISSIVLAAGDGTRMKSEHPKVLCPVLFKPMILWVTDCLKSLGVKESCVVVGNGAEEVAAVLPEGTRTYLQSERRGTGHAVMMAADLIDQHLDGDIVVLCGDAPFVSAEVLRNALDYHRAQGAAVTVISASLNNPAGYGRIVRSRDGALLAIVEEKDADPKTKQISEVNSGAYWFKGRFLKEALSKLTCENAQGEYYLTDTVKIAVELNQKAVAFTSPDADIIKGVNNRRQLSELNRYARDKVLNQLMDAGVDIPLSDGILISPDAQIGPDTTILPGTIIQGKCVVGKGCVIGPDTLLENSVVEDGCTVNSSQVHQSKIGANSKIGPFTYIRPGCNIGERAKIGDFVELKNSNVGARTSVSHLTYIGDSDFGEGINVGCGVVTVNYDGMKKYRTTVKDGAFIGCNTNLIAPVTVEEGAYIAAGTTITSDVPAGSLAIGRCRQEIKEHRATGKFKGR